MEGNLAIRQPNVLRRMPALCIVMFGLGAALEFVMCKTGFYNVVAVSEGQKTATSPEDQDEFWMRVRARREAREKLVTIKDPE